MIEQFKMLAQLFSGLSGASVKELRAKVLAQANIDTPYEELSPRDKAGVDENVSGMQELSRVFDTLIDAKAVMTFKFYKSLQKAGFSQEEALQIASNQSVDMVKSS